MSDLQSSSDYWNHCSPASGISKESSDSDSDNFVFRDDFLPYQEEPLASTSDSEDETNDDNVEDEDGISRVILERRFEKEIPLEQW